PAPSPITTPTPKSRAKDVGLFDPNLKKSIAEPVTGDLRPIYVFSGRLKNLSSQNITDVTVRVAIFANDKIFDQADLHINRAIPPNAVTGFSEEVRIMPPRGKWNWAFSVMDAH